MRLAKSPHSVRFQNIVHLIVMILDNQFSKGLPPVEKELLALLDAADNLPGKNRQPRPQRVAPAGGEFLLHPRCPGSFSCLVTVYEKILYDSLSAKFPANGIAVQF